MTSVWIGVTGILFGSSALLVVRFLWVAYRRKLRASLGFSVGDGATAETSLAPLGYVCVGGEIWPAVADREVPSGANVRIVGSSGIRLKVVPENESF